MTSKINPSFHECAMSWQEKQHDSTGNNPNDKKYIIAMDVLSDGKMTATAEGIGVNTWVMSPTEPINPNESVSAIWKLLSNENRSKHKEICCKSVNKLRVPQYEF